jgi:hypothetical protein
MADSMFGREIPPRWAFERVEHENCIYWRAIPDNRNVDIWLRDPATWSTYHAWAAYIARTESPPVAAPSVPLSPIEKHDGEGNDHP